MSTVSWLLGSETSDEDLRNAWEPILFNQFHDVICGCHTDKVFANAIHRYECSKVLVEGQMEKDIKYLVDRIDTRGEGIPLVIFNQLAWKRTDVVEYVVALTDPDVFGLSLRNSKGDRLPIQILEEERYNSGGLKTARIIFVAEKVPSMGYEVYRLILSQDVDLKTHVRAEKNGSVGLIESDFYTVKVDLRNGAIMSIRDRDGDWELIDKNRQVIS